VARKGDFSEQEWDALRKGVTGAGLMVAVADRGLFDSFKEAGALASHLADARRTSSSQIVRELAEERGMGFGLGTPPDELERETLASLGMAVSALESKAPEDVDEYRRFVLEVAESVAGAAGGGETSEPQSIEKLRSALSGSSPA
jgi:hypothetical protein